MTALNIDHKTLTALAALLGVKAPRKRRSDAGFTKDLVQEAQSVDERRKALEEATIKAFTKAGYKDIQPRVNVLTYGKHADGDKPATGWIAQGRMVRKGEKSVHVKAPGMKGRGIALFHVTQTDPIATESAQSAA